tara:strand:+ start:95 stop:463 length:369 start_codon:yes stop_codon:yes gene_type:complete
MKTKLTLFVTVIAVALFGTGCATSQPTLKIENVVGVYEVKWPKETFRSSFLEDGTMKRWSNGKELADSKWKIEGNEVHVEHSDGVHFFFRVGKNSDLTQVSVINPGKNRKTVKGGWTYKKIQ